MSTPASPIVGQGGDEATVQSFAAKVRAKFPGAYDDLDDSTLSQKVVAKHPEYADMLPKTFGTQPVAPVPKPPRIGFKEQAIEPAADIVATGAEKVLPAVGMVAGGAAAAPEAVATGPAAPAVEALAGAGGYAGGAAAARGLRAILPTGEMQRPPTLKREAAQTAEDVKTGAEYEMGGRAAGAALGPIVSRVAPVLKRAVGLGPTEAKAANLFERGAGPGSDIADQEAQRINEARVRKYIADETRNYPISQGDVAKTTRDTAGNPLTRNETGAMRTATVTHRAATNLWDRTVQPLINIFGDVQRPGSEIADAIREANPKGVTAETAPGRASIKANGELAQAFDHPMTVKEMADEITNLNNNKAVSNFHGMTPAEQVQAEIGDPSLRGKLAALDKLRETVFDAIGETGSNPEAEGGRRQLGREFAEARRDWGALRDIEDRIRSVTPVEAKQPWAIRLMHAITSPADSLQEYMNNPNRLLPKWANMLGETNLTSPTVNVTPQFPRALLPGAPGPGLPAPPDISGPTGGPGPDIQPLAENRQLPPAPPVQPLSRRLTPANGPGDTFGGPVGSGGVPLPTAERGPLNVPRATETPRAVAMVRINPEQAAERPTGAPPANVMPEGKPEAKPITQRAAAPEKAAAKPMRRASAEDIKSIDDQKTLRTIADDASKPFATRAKALDRLNHLKYTAQSSADIERESRIADLKDIASGKVEPWGGVDRRDAQEILKNSYSGPERRAPGPKAPTAADAAKERQRLIDNGIVPENERGLSAESKERKPPAREKQPAPTLNRFSPEVLNQAKAEMRGAAELGQTLPRAGRYFDEYDESVRPQNMLEGETRAGRWRGVTSQKPNIAGQFPWFADPDMSLSKIERALAKGKGAEYERILEKVAESVEKDMAKPINKPNSLGAASANDPVFPGMETAVKEQDEAAARARAEEMTNELNRPKGDIERAAGEMESKSPLFRGTAASPQNEMFTPGGKPPAKPLSRPKK
jgi:hypothetical protein